MDSDLPAEGRNRRLNNMVAVTVVILSVFMGIANIKDDNIVQAMQQAKTESVDRWSQYQANRMKLHISEAARDQETVLAATSPSAAAKAAPMIQRLDQAIAKYEKQTPDIRGQAEELDRRYDALNVHDDQFDAADALIAIAISMAGVAALAEAMWLLVLAWGFGGFGIVLGVAGFAGWSLHPDFLARLLS
jgi:hypothetical protein